MKTDEAPDLVVGCDESGNLTNYLEKMRAHRDRQRHRAVSVLLFADDGALLIQKRALSKYHSGGLWTNSACTHPAPAETHLAAAMRAIGVELGIETNLDFVLTANYDLQVSPAMYEVERTDVFVGRCPPPPWNISLNEVSEVALRSLSGIVLDAESNPNKYTEWFKYLLRNHYEPISNALHRP